MTRTVRRLAITLIAALVLPAAAGAQGEEKPPTGYVYSTYFECEMGEQERADEIMATVFAPIYNRHVADGTIASWGWLKHHVGGEWRRLLTMTGKDHVSLLAARDAIIDEMVSKHEAETKEYDDICDSHQDYMWDIVHETP